MNIESRDISVIVQGPIDWSNDEELFEATTLTCLRKIKSILPDSEIILSTWENEHITGLDYDKLVVSSLPEQQGVWPGFIPNNVNRQIVSTVNGLKHASRKYALKIRTDMILLGDKFLSFFQKRPNGLNIEDERRIFKDPIVTNNFSSRNSDVMSLILPDHPLLFQFSDHIQFGNTEDLIMLWDINLQKNDDGFYFFDHSHPNRWRLCELSLLAPEQYILTRAIKKKYPLEIKHYADTNTDLIKLSKYYLNSHFTIIPDQVFPVRFQKYHNEHHFSFEWMRLSHLDYLIKEMKIEHNSQGVKWLGFSNPETGFRWSNATYSEIKFEWRGESFSKGKFAICFDTFKRQNIIITLNGKEIFKNKLKAQNKSIVVDFEGLEKGSNTIGFKLPDAAVPGGNDSRKISVAIRNIRICSS